MELKTVIEGCLAGDAKSQKLLFDYFAPKMLTVCKRYTNDQMEAEDVLQEGFIKLFQRMDSFTFQGSFEGWVRRLFVNTALDHLRKEKKNKFLEDVDDIGIHLDAEAYIIEGLEAEHLMKLLEVIPSGYRVVFNLFAIEGYSHKEIGELLNVTESTSKSQYFRAKSFIQKKLEELNVTRY